MKTATVREIRQNFPRILAWVQEGEEVTITSRRKVVARLSPPRPEKRKRKVEVPDFEAIQERILGPNREPFPDFVAMDREGRF